MISDMIVMMRERAGLSQAALAERLGMKRAQLCVIEKGRFKPTERTLQRIAAALDIDRRDLDGTGPDGELVPTRGGTKVPDAVVERALRAERKLDRLESARGVVSATTLPLVHAYVRQPHASEILAQSLRDALGVGRAAFSDLVWTLEFANVRVRLVELPEDCPSVGWWRPARGTLTLAVDRRATPERQLYRLAYELGAACLFRSSGDHPVAVTQKEHRFLAEFAADFLMPAAAIADIAAKTGIRPHAWTFDQLLLFKNHFGVSAETFALRLQELGLIDKSLRESFRTKLRAYYKAHPRAMEPAPRRAPLRPGPRERMIRGTKEGKRF